MTTTAVQCGVKSGEASLVEQLKSPWKGASESKDADAEVQRLYRLCQAAGTALEAIAGTTKPEPK